LLELHTPVQYVKGIGPRIAEALAAKGITTVEDLLYYLPFRYEDRTRARSLEELRPGEVASIIVEVRAAGLFRTRRRHLQIFQMTAGQGRSSIQCLWFHGGYLRDVFRPGQVVALHGKVEPDQRGGALQFIQPQFEILSGPEASGEDAESRVGRSLEIGRIVPIYESAAGQKLSSRWFRRVIHGALENLAPGIADGVPAAIRRRQQLIARDQAFERVHFPAPEEKLSALENAGSAAHQRLIFEELFFLEVGLELKRRRLRQRPGIVFGIDDKVRQALKRILPFHPTAAQKRVLKEIAGDMQQPIPMRRLLQGDVGSGKTIVALEAAVIAIENGFQVALMAPTEILATQHYLSARRVLENAGYRIVLLTGSLEPERKRDTRRHIARGEAQLVIGTHALIQEKVEFARLGLVIVDEQHRFGVMQRFKLMKKTAEREPQRAPSMPGNPQRKFLRARVGDPGGADPDVLVMTATPIPRTLALTLYGDLDVSLLDELPPGRTPIVTRMVSDERAAEVWAFVRQQAAAGHQAYVVYPVIEGGKQDQPELEFAGAPAKVSELKAAIQMYDELRQRVFPDLRVGLLHGRLEAEEKDRVMRRFQRGEIDVLVSTTVIEVGVDVANATVMVIEHAERFGLSQLHQLRGRIGRGAARSYCVLMTGGKISPEGQQRLDAMIRTQDGFEIAELDLALRGPGEFFGTRQAGMPGFRVANLLRDRRILEAAKREAAILVAGSDSEIGREEVETALHHLRAHWQRRYGLVEVG